MDLPGNGTSESGCIMTPLRGIAKETRKGSPRFKAQMLTGAYNEATCPWNLRTDDESREFDRYARAIRKRLNTVDGRWWYELDNGALRARGLS